MEAITPWQARSQRKAAIAVARRERERSQAGARHAAGVQNDIEALAARNHFAASLMAQIIQRHLREGGAA